METRTLYERALGYVREDVKGVYNSDGKLIGIETTYKHIPSDVEACIEYLTTHDPENWKR